MPEWGRVADCIERFESSADDAAIGVSIRTSSGAEWSHRGDRQFRAASIVKVPLMIEIFRMIDRGECALDDVHTVSTDRQTPGSGVLLHLHDGIHVTTHDLLYLTMAISDNTATNMLIDLAGMDAVNVTMREIGMVRSNLSRPMRGRPATAGEVENLATADDYVNAIDAILGNRAASARSCEAMRALLMKQQNDRRIARYVPADTDREWGSKTGSLIGVTNDVGFVSSEAGTLMIAVLCEGLPDQHIGEEAIGSVTREALLASGI